MSRIGKYPVPVPAGVEVRIDGAKVRAKGKLGELDVAIPDGIEVKLDDGKVVVTPLSEHRKVRVMWGTIRTLINNIVTGVSKGFTVELELAGVGYRAAVQGKDLVLQLGFSHEIKYPIPTGITVKTEKPTQIAISGADRKQVGQIAAEIRAYRPPEPYKGKGVKYANEKILRKEGKKK